MRHRFVYPFHMRRLGVTGSAAYVEQFDKRPVNLIVIKLITWRIVSAHRKCTPSRDVETKNWVCNWPSRVVENVSLANPQILMLEPSLCLWISPTNVLEVQERHQRK